MWIKISFLLFLSIKINIYSRGRPTDAVVIWKPQPVFCDFVRSFSDDQESESTVVITEITDEEEEKINNQYKMLVEDNE